MTRRVTSHPERLLLPVLISTSDEIKGVAQMADPVRARRLSDHEGQTLTQIVRRGRGNSVRVRRATIIMASASGTSVVAIARLVAADEDTVRDVIHAFNERGVPEVGRGSLTSGDHRSDMIPVCRCRCCI